MCFPLHAYLFLSLSLSFFLFPFKVPASQEPGSENPLNKNDFKACTRLIQREINRFHGPFHWFLAPAVDSKGTFEKNYMTFFYGKNGDQNLPKAISLSRKGNKIQLLLIFPTNQHLLRWKTGPSISNCSPLPVVVSPLKEELPSIPSTSGSFSDRDLGRLLKKNGSGLIYLWSPHMPYSISNMERLIFMTQRHGLHLTVLMDPSGDSEELKLVLENKENRRFLKSGHARLNTSRRLMSQGGSLHYPSTFFYRKGVLLPDQLLGAKSSGAYQDYIEGVFGKTITAPSKGKRK